MPNMWFEIDRHRNQLTNYMYQAAGEFLPEYDGWAYVDRTRKWDATLYGIEDNTRAIPANSLDVIPWLRKTAEPIAFWPREKRRTHKEKGAKKKRPDAPPPIHDTGDVPPIADADDSSSNDGGDPVPFPHSDGPGEGEHDWWEEFQPLLDEFQGLMEPKPPPHPPKPPSDGKGKGDAGEKGVGKGPDADPLVPPVEPRDDVPHGPRYEKLYVNGPSGEPIGYFLINNHSRRFDCHCLRHGGDCAIGRSWVPWNEAEGKLTPMRAAKGRCLAFLLAWLWFGLDIAEGEAHKDEHMTSAKALPGTRAAVLGNGRSDERIQARVRVEGEPTLAPLRAIERQPRVGEPLEPHGKL